MEPKTESSRATVPMTEPVRVALTELKARQTYEKMLTPLWLDSWGLCFTSAVGEYIPRSRLYADYRAVLKAAGLGHLRFHDLRHSTGSILFAQGVPMKVIQMILRHGQISTTMDTYIHLRSEGLNEAKIAMERALTGGSSPE
jgi:integrase